MNMDTAYHGATRTRYCHIAHSGMMHWEWELLNNITEEDTPPPLDPIDALMAKYAGEIDKMYDRRTRGDYSSIGILAAFMADLKKLEK